MAYRAVVFDLFGTLVPTFSQKAHDLVLEHVADLLAVPAAEFVELWVHSYQERATGKIGIEAQIAAIATRLGRRPSEEQISHSMRLRLELVRDSLTPRADAVPTIRSLRRRGHKIGLISDCSPEPAVLWPTTSLASLIDVALFSCVEGVCKPDRRIYLSACDRLSVSPLECLYVGDGGSDELAGAASAGMHPVHLRAFRADEDHGYDDAREHWSGPAVGALSDVLDLV